MTVLLDTSTWLWMTLDSKRLGRRARTLLEDPEQKLIFSAASGWEIVIKAARGKLDLPKAPSEFVRVALYRQRIETLAITLEHALGVSQLRPIHHDPFDRLIAAQALHENMTLLSPNPIFKEYGVAFADARR